MTYEELSALAAGAGFTAWAALDASTIELKPQVRDMCAADRCQSYNRNWSCPPACGTAQVCADRMSAFAHGVLVQTTGAMEDDFDAETIGETYLRHKRNFETLARQTRLLHPDCLPLTAGACTLCRRCTYPDRPCRFPKKRLSSMEAYGLLVSDVCVQSGVPYNHGSKTITYTSCILFD